MAESDLGLVRHALETARERAFAEVEVEADGIKFSAKLEPRRAVHAAIVSALAITPDSEAHDPGYAEIVSPCVGYFQDGPSPIEPGMSVERDAVVACIQALGIANDVVASCSGEIEEVFIRKGQPVEYGQTLARVKVKV